MVLFELVGGPKKITTTWTNRQTDMCVHTYTLYLSLIKKNTGYRHRLRLVIPAFGKEKQNLNELKPARAA